MFIPLKDANSTRKFPQVTVALILANIIVFTVEFITGDMLWPLFACYPHRIMELLQLKITRIIYLPGLFSYMFLHSGLLHLLGNLLFLWIFGDNIEDRLGRLGFLKFYLVCGLAAALCHVFLVQDSTIPMVGASGAIAGVLGAYLVLFPRAKITTLVFFWIVQIPALVFLVMWLSLQIYFSIFSEDGSVAWFAHIGGFITGMVLALPFALRKGKKR